MGALLCGWGGQSLGHLVIWLLWGCRFLYFCADGGEDVLEGEGGWGVRCRIARGDMAPCWVLGVLLYGDGGVDVVFRRPSVQIVVKGVVVLPAVECKGGVEAVPDPPGWAEVGRGCRFQEGVHCGFSGVVQEKAVFWAPLVVAQTGNTSRFDPSIWSGTH